jgi:hypothetical protein
MVDGVNNDGKNEKTRKPRGFGKRFAPGNPGRPKGTKNKRTIIIENLVQERFEDIVERVIKAAVVEGDMMAAKMLLDRLWPIRKGAAVNFPLPEHLDSDGLLQTFDALIRATANGELTAEEASAVAGVVEQKRRAIETQELQERIEALEERTASNTGARTWPQ